MTIASKLLELNGVKESLRIKLGLTPESSMIDQLDAITGATNSDDFSPNPEELVVIQQLRKVLHIKEKMRVALGLDIGVPFSEYHTHITEGGDPVDPPVGDAPPIVLDFLTQSYTVDGVEVPLESVASVSRPSPATLWIDNVLLDIEPDTPRISEVGLTIEEEATNLLPNNTTYNESSLSRVSAEHYSDSIVGNYTKLISRGSYTGLHMSDTSDEQDVGRTIRSVIVRKSLDNANFLSLRDSSNENGLTYDSVANDITRVSGSSQNIDAHILDRGDYVELWYSDDATRSKVRHSLAMGDSVQAPRSIVSRSGDSFEIAYPMLVPTLRPDSTIIKTTSGPETRAADILEVQMDEGHNIFGDWDEGVSVEIVGRIARFVGHGKVRRIISAGGEGDMSPEFIYPAMIAAADGLNTLANIDMFDKLGVV